MLRKKRLLRENSESAKNPAVSDKTATTPYGPEESSDLLLSEAVERNQRLSNIECTLTVDLTSNKPEKKEETYSCKLGLWFDLGDVSTNLRLDFYEGEVLSMEIKGSQLNSEVNSAAKKRYWIEIPAASLKGGTNQVSISFKIFDFRVASMGLVSLTFLNPWHFEGC